MTRRLFFNYLPFLFLIASFFTSCNRSHEKKSGSKDNTLVVKLVATSIEVAQSYVADVQAVQFVEVKPKVEGFVEDVLVDEGEHVKKGQVLGIIEAMKLMNEYTAPEDGEILDICIQNEELVEFGQVLFKMV